jgi:hypothetical protein
MRAAKMGAKDPTKGELASRKQNDGGKAGDGKCVVCLDRKCDTACVPCGHKCLCQICSQVIMGSEGQMGQQMVCPLCREEVMMTMQVYE